RNGPEARDEVSEQLRAVDDRDSPSVRRRHVGDRVLDRGRDHQGGAVPRHTAPVLGVDRDAEPLELLARLTALATVEGAVAAAGAPAAHHLELGERADAAPSQAGGMEAAGAPGV